MKRSAVSAYIVLLGLGYGLCGCATIADLIPNLIPTVQSLLLDLDSTLTEYENDALVTTEDPFQAFILQAAQEARKAAILKIITRLTNQYPEISTTDFLERLNLATAIAPDG